MTSIVKVWKLTPEQMASYKTGMDLGEPHRIEYPEPPKLTKILTIKPRKKSDGTKNKRKPSKQRKEFMTKEEYIAHREKGLNIRQIADLYKVDESTVRRRKKEWGLGI